MKTTYLEYVTYLLFLGVFLFLLNKIIQNENSVTANNRKATKEGFVAKKTPKINYDKNGLPIEDPDNPGTPDPRWLTITKLNYRIAADVAILIIKMPYQFLNKGVEMIRTVISNLNEMLDPMYKFIRQIFNIFKDLFIKVFKQFFNIFKKAFKIFGDLPGFIKKNAERMVNFINSMVQQFMRSIKTVLDIFQKIFDMILKLPETAFTLFNKGIEMFFNGFVMMMKLPTSMLQMGIGMQDKMISLMDRPLKIPFENMFFG